MKKLLFSTAILLSICTMAQVQFNVWKTDGTFVTFDADEVDSISILPNEAPIDTTIAPVGTTYPRVQLIEHFTGASCGYCPEGMNNIYDEYIKDQDNIVWVSNHYGYGRDAYTVTGSSAIGSKLQVEGAPCISVNRTKCKFDGVTSYNYHPYYTPDALSKMADTSTEKITLERTFDAATGNLHVKAHILTSREDLEGVKLTIGITESGMQGVQADYYYSWEGWTKFIHTHTVRVYASASLGDTCRFDNRKITAEYDINIKSAWVARNCEIVAWITPFSSNYDVLNAAKLPVIRGTAGGEDIKHGGVEAKPVSDTYPESGAPKDTIALANAYGEYYTYNNLTVMHLYGFNQSLKCGTNSYGYTLFPYADFYLVLNAGATTIPTGTYPILPTDEAEQQKNAVVAGSRNDELLQLEGSMLYYVFLYNSSLYTDGAWYIDAGTLTVTDEGFTLEVTTKNKSAVRITYEGNITYSAAKNNAPAQRLVSKRQLER